MDKKAIINQYINSWNEKDELKRREILKISFTENGIYLDPHIPKPVSNVEDMNEIIKTFQFFGCNGKWTTKAPFYLMVLLLVSLMKQIK
jgi:hypothetical protein